ncbi:hypothetical protein JBKA6_0853 [Ichthyobacterium seriolicida]|uniref:Uncharacterized protein n=1 Tax=Ichthyobacterium seriolicida TaxID=242600 RepID=A0A1J1DY97_9FLAO|nr:hypothetical protein JBKA6_0853 [Ichthyobacterium seriolicida]
MLLKQKIEKTSFELDKNEQPWDIYVLSLKKHVKTPKKSIYMLKNDAKKNDKEEGLFSINKKN